MRVKRKESALQEQPELILVPPGRKPIDKEKKKEVNVKVTRTLHERLKRSLYQQKPEWGKVASDLGDWIEKLQDYWDEQHKG